MVLRPESAETWEHRTDADDSGAGAWEHRIDRGAVLSSVRRADGTLLVEGVAAKAGILTYRRADGTERRELVREDTLRRSAAGLGRAPVTLHHPDPKKHPKGVTPENVGELGVGDTDGEVEWVADGGFVRVKLAVRRRDALDAIAQGTQELSPGYGVLLGPGGHDAVYGQFDAEQLERAYNHLSIVDAARGGADVRLYLDDATAICTETITGATPSAGSPAPTPNINHDGGALRSILQEIARLVGIGDQRFDSDESLARACQAALAQRNDAADKRTQQLEQQVQTLTTERDTERKRADTEKGRADGAEGEAKKLRDAAQQRADAEARKELEALCQELNLDATGKDLKALRRLVAATELGEEVRADASDDYVQGLVDRAKKTAKTRADGRKAGDRAWDPLPHGAGGQAGLGNAGARRDSGGTRPVPVPPPAPATGSSYAARIQARQDGRRHDARGEGGEG